MEKEMLFVEPEELRKKRKAQRIFPLPKIFSYRNIDHCQRMIVIPILFIR